MVATLTIDGEDEDRNSFRVFTMILFRGFVGRLLVLLECRLSDQVSEEAC